MQQIQKRRYGRKKLPEGPAKVRAIRIPEDEWQEIVRKTRIGGFKSPAAFLRRVAILAQIK